MPKGRPASPWCWISGEEFCCPGMRQRLEPSARSGSIKSMFAPCRCKVKGHDCFFGPRRSVAAATKEPDVSDGSLLAPKIRRTNGYPSRKTGRAEAALAWHSHKGRH